LLVRFATGTAANHVSVWGANSSGVIDGTRPEIKATGTWSTAISYFIIGTDAGANPIRYVDWYNIDWNANSSSATTGSYNCINNSGITTTGIGTATTAYYHTFTNCIFRNAKHNGISLFSGSVGSEVAGSFTFTNCQITGNGISATGSGAIGRGATAMTHFYDRCVFSGNFTGGIASNASSDATLRVYGCTFDASTNGVGLSVTQQRLEAYGCTFSNNATNGITMPWRADSYIQRNRFINNASSAIQDQTADGTETSYPYNRNLFFGNAFDYSDSLVSRAVPGFGNVFQRNFPPARGRERR
jgi:hypothetical protein